MDKWAELKELYQWKVQCGENALEESNLDPNGKMELMNFKHVLVEMERIEEAERKEEKKDELKWKIHRRYTDRITKFLNNFGIFDWEYTNSNLWLKFEGAFWEQRQLCMNMGLKHFETYEEDVEMLEADMSWEYLRTIMHLWENITKFEVIK